MRLAGKVAVITGAAGGIGAATARRFVEEGADVGLLDLPSTALDDIAGELGDSAFPLPADVTDTTSLAAAFERVRSRADRLDVLYCCAAIQLHELEGPVDRIAVETWRRVLDVNLTGAFLSVKHALPLLRSAGGGSIILCGSPTAMTMCGRGYPAYAASKGGLAALAQSLAGDHAAEKIRVNVLVPGTTSTPLISPLLQEEETARKLLAGTPLGRIGTPEDTTGLAVYLASDESSYATAGTFVVDGGLTRR